MNIYHIMPIDSFYFNATTINMINDNANLSTNINHIFVVNCKEVYEKYKTKNKVIYEPNINGKRRVKILKKYLSKSDYLFLHSNYLKIYDWIKINNKDLHKIIWCLWGHDLYDRHRFDTSNIIKIIRGIIKKAFIKMEQRKINKIFGIAIGFKYDAIEVRKLYKKVKILPFLYGYQKDSLKINNEIFNNQNKKNIKKPVKIMIGHSGYKFLNHCNILDKLYKFKNNDIIISLPMNYGDANYIEKVEKYAYHLYGDKVEIIKDKMDYKQYIDYIKSVDICILDFKKQAALGNLWLLLKNGTKLFLNKDGIIKLSLNLEMIESYNVDQIEKMDYNEFSKKIKDKEKGVLFANTYLDDKTAIYMYEILMNEIKKDMEDV